MVRFLRNHWTGFSFLAGSGLVFAGLRQVSLGSFVEPGPALFPALLAALLAVLTFILIWRERHQSGNNQISWPLLRPSLAILLSVLTFAACIEGFSSLRIPALGMPVAGMLALLASGLADKTTRWPQLTVLAATLPLAFAVALRFGLGQPVPIAPWWLGF